MRHVTVRPGDPEGPGAAAGWSAGTVARVDPGAGEDVTAREKTATIEIEVGVVLVALVALAGAYLAWRPESGTIDGWFFGIFPTTKNGAFTAITTLRQPWLVIVGSVVVCAATVSRDLPRALACLVGPPAALIAAEVVAKPLVGRTLGGGLSYPSGSTVGAAALACAVVLATPPAFRTASVVLGALYAFWMTLAVVAAGWHYPTDAFAGLALGVGTVLLADGLFRRVADAFRPARAAGRGHLRRAHLRRAHPRHS
ncbi:MAG: phosphatase PAP2 family protein [Acidimicrobiales bacterium]